MNGLIIGVHVLVSFFIIFVVLLQIGRGAELGAAFGSMGQANSQRGKASTMSKVTAIVAFLFMLTSFLLTYNTTSMQKSSVLDQVESSQPLTPAEPAEVAPAAEPVETAPAAETTPAGVEVN